MVMTLSHSVNFKIKSKPCNYQPGRGRKKKKWIIWEKVLQKLHSCKKECHIIHIHKVKMV